MAPSWLQRRQGAADEAAAAATATTTTTTADPFSSDNTTATTKAPATGWRAWFSVTPPPQPPRYYRVPDEATFAPALPAELPDLDAQKRRSAVREEIVNIKESVTEARHHFKTRSANWKWWEKLACVLPCAQWIGEYRIREDLPWDLLAALSVSLLVVPQSMSYALLAGVPSVWGLYGAFLPVLTYAVFGSSKQLSVGPVAVTSILIGNGLKPIVPGAEFVADPNNLDTFQYDVQQQYNRSVIQLAALVGIFYTAVGVLRLGWVISFISTPVTYAFTSGAAITIAVSQVKYLLGYNVPRRDSIQENIAVLYENRVNFRWTELALGGSALAFILIINLLGSLQPKRKLWQVLKPASPMLMSIVGIVVVAVGKFNYWPDSPFKTIMYIPSGLPKYTGNQWFPLDFPATIIPLAVVVTLVDLLESTSIARAMARKNNYRLVYNREIWGLGVANLVGAAFNCYSTTGSFSRTAVKNQARSKTQFAGVCVGIIVMLVLLFLTKLFALLPYCIMAAVIIGGVSTLIEVKYAYTLFRTDLRDFLIFMVTFFVVIFYSIDVGLGVGIGLSLFIYILETGFPSKQRLGRFISGGAGDLRAFGNSANNGKGSNGNLASPSAAAKANGNLIIDAKGGRGGADSNSDDPTSGSDAALDQNAPLKSTPTPSSANITSVDTFVDEAEFAGLAQPLPSGVVALRLQAPIAFNNVQALEDAIEDIVVDTELAHRDDPDKHPLVQYIILDLASSGHIDSSGCHSIGTEIAERMALKGVQVALVGANQRILRALERTGALSKGNLRAWVFTNLADAVAATQHTRLVLTEAAKEADAKAAELAELAEKKKAKKEARAAKKAAAGAAAAGAEASAAAPAVAAGVV